MGNTKNRCYVLLHCVAPNGRVTAGGTWQRKRQVAVMAYFEAISLHFLEDLRKPKTVRLRMEFEPGTLKHKAEVATTS